MPRFFINESPSRQAIITGEDSKHITKSLRMKVGESLVLWQRSRYGLSLHHLLYGRASSCGIREQFCPHYQRTFCICNIISGASQI